MFKLFLLIISVLSYCGAATVPSDPPYLISSFADADCTHSCHLSESSEGEDGIPAIFRGKECSLSDRIAEARAILSDLRDEKDPETVERLIDEFGEIMNDPEVQENFTYISGFSIAIELESYDLACILSKGHKLRPTSRRALNLIESAYKSKQYSIADLIAEISLISHSDLMQKLRDLGHHCFTDDVLACLARMTPKMLKNCTPLQFAQVFTKSLEYVDDHDYKSQIEECFLNELLQRLPENEIKQLKVDCRKNLLYKAVMMIEKFQNYQTSTDCTGDLLFSLRNSTTREALEILSKNGVKICPVMLEQALDDLPVNFLDCLHEVLAKLIKSYDEEETLAGRQHFLVLAETLLSVPTIKRTFSKVSSLSKALSSHNKNLFMLLMDCSAMDLSGPQGHNVLLDAIITEQEYAIEILTERIKLDSATIIKNLREVMSSLYPNYVLNYLKVVPKLLSDFSHYHLLSVYEETLKHWDSHLTAVDLIQVMGSDRLNAPEYFHPLMEHISTMLKLDAMDSKTLLGELDHLRSTYGSLKERTQKQFIQLYSGFYAPKLELALNVSVECGLILVQKLLLEIKA